MAVTTSTTLASDVRNFIAEETLAVAFGAVRFYQFGEKVDLPPQHGTTFTFTRYDKLNLPQSVLSEGTAATDTALGITQVSATAEQWGGLVTITDVAELTIAHKPLQKAINLLGIQAAELIDREIERVLFAGTNAYFGDTSVDTSRVNIATDATTTETAIKTIVANLRSNGAMGMEAPDTAMDDPVLGDLYVGIIDPYVEMDISTFANFISATQYRDAKRLYNGEAGEYAGVRFVRSNLLPSITSAAAVTATVASGAGLTSGGSSRIHHVITGVDVSTGYERLIHQPGSDLLATTVAASVVLNLTMPTDTSFTYNVYVTDVSTAPTSQNARLHSSDNTAASAVTVSAVPATTANTVPALTAGAGSRVHLSYFIGKEAYSVVNLANLTSYLTPASASDSDPFLQRRKASWKVFFKAVINNQNFMARYESESAHD